MINLSNVVSLPVKQDYNVKNKQEKNNLADSSKNKISPTLVSPNVEHLKANYLTFGVNKKPADVKIFEPKNKVEPPAEELSPSFSNMLSEEALSDAIKFEPYKKTADFIAQNCFKGDNTMLAYEEGAMPELVANNFASMLDKGKFKKLGLTRETADVHFFSTEDLMAECQNPEEMQQKVGESMKILAEKAAESDKLNLIFISDPTIIYPRINSPQFKTIAFAPLQPDASGHNMMLPERIQKIIGMDPSVSLLDLPPAGAPETKSFLKANKDVLIDLPDGLIVSDKAIDKAVNMTKEKYGSYPGKAIDFLVDVVPAVLMKKRVKNNSQYAVLTPKNIDKAVAAYPTQFEESAQSGPYNLILDTKIKLKDVGGIEQTEDFLRESIINKISTPNKKSNDVPPSSVLIEGVSGSGKSFLAKAIAGEVNSPIVIAPAMKILGGQIHPKELIDFTKTAARDSDNKTAFLYINDFDILAADPKSKSEIDIYRTELFDEIKKIDNKNSDVNVIVLASSQDSKVHQEEFSKKGVFETQIQTPDNGESFASRISTIKLFTKDLEFKNEKSKKEIIEETAKITGGATGADLKTIIHKASAIADRRKDKNLAINDIYESLIELQAGPVIKSEDPVWKKELVIKHETGHAVVAQTLFNMAKEDWQKPNEIHLITFDPRGDMGGFVSFGPGKNGMLSFNSLIDQMAISYGGLHSEKQMFKGDFTSGPSEDLKQATHLAKVGAGLLAKGKNTGFVTDPVMMASENKEDVKLFVNVGSKISEMIIDFHKGFINEYGEECFNKLGKGGNTMSAKVFKGRLDTWLDKDDRREKLKLLETKVEILKDEARLHSEFIDDDKFLTELAEDKMKTDAASSSKKA